MTATVLERESSTAVQSKTKEAVAQASHIVKVPAGEKDQTPQAYVLRARIEGFAIEALCGHIFVPSRNPEPLPVCSTCLEIFQYDPWAIDPNDREELPKA